MPGSLWPKYEESGFSGDTLGELAIMLLLMRVSMSTSPWRQLLNAAGID